MKYGLVLEGGGVRGAFHVGVWKALRKMNIEICAVAGASIGAYRAGRVRYCYEAVAADCS